MRQLSQKNEWDFQANFMFQRVLKVFDTNNYANVLIRTIE